MARIRTIKPAFFRHEELFEAEQKTGFPLRLAFAGLFIVADRSGRFRWQPRNIKLDVLPYDEIDFGAVLDALAAHGFIIKYQVGDSTFGCIPSFEKHQHVNQREAESELPAPDDDGARTCENIPARGEQEREGKGKGTGREGNMNDALTREFAETFWPEFPNKVGKPKALQAFLKARQRHSLETIMGGLRNYIEAKPPDRQWLNPATFFNQERFLDEPAPVATAQPTKEAHFQRTVREHLQEVDDGSILEFGTGRRALCGPDSERGSGELHAAAAGHEDDAEATHDAVHRRAKIDVAGFG